MWVLLVYWWSSTLAGGVKYSMSHNVSFTTYTKWGVEGSVKNQIFGFYFLVIIFFIKNY